MGHCDNPLGGIYNPYQIKKQPFAYLAFWAAFHITHCFFLFVLLFFLPSNRTMCVITTSVADKTQNPSFKQVQSHQTVSCSH